MKSVFGQTGTETDKLVCMHTNQNITYCKIHITDTILVHLPDIPKYAYVVRQSNIYLFIWLGSREFKV